MPYNTQQIKRDQQNSPIPQYFNPTTDVYEPLLGRNGANRVELYGPDGTPIGTTAGKLNVRASEIESILTTIQGYVDGLEAALGEVQATPTTYTVLARLKDLSDRLGEVSSTPTANTLLARLKSLEDKIDAITSGATPATARLTGSIETINTNPVVGVKTVTATAASIFAGGSVKSNRRKLILRNEDPVLRFRIGPSTVTQQNGFPVEPGAVVIIPFDPAVIVPIYAISEGASLQVSVMEV